MAQISREVILHCPRCGEVMIYEQEQDFWRCPRCCGEWWEDESKVRFIESEKREKEDKEKLRWQLRWSLAKGYTEVLPLGGAIGYKGRGNKSGRKRKKPVKKRRPWEII